MLLAHLVPVHLPDGVPGQQQRQRALCKLLLLADLDLVLFPGLDLLELHAVRLESLPTILGLHVVLLELLLGLLEFHVVLLELFRGLLELHAVFPELLPGPLESYVVLLELLPGLLQPLAVLLELHVAQASCILFLNRTMLSSPSCAFQ